MHNLQKSINTPVAPGNSQAMNQDKPTKTFNVPVRIQGWFEEVGARVEVLVPIPELKIRAGQIFHAKLRYDPKKLDKNQITFKFYYGNMGLRVGGIVLLKKVMLEGDDGLSAKELDVLFETPRYGQVALTPNAAAFIMPPPAETTEMVEDGLIAVLDDAEQIKGSIASAVSAVQIALEMASRYGKPGIIITGETESGEAAEYQVGGTGDLPLEQILASIAPNISPEDGKWIAKSKKPWFLVPFFRANVDPDRAGRFAAQRKNIQYGEDGEPLWTPCSCLLRNPGDGWVINDTTPLRDGDSTPLLLLDFLDNRR
jgi:hypothetical protein